MPVHVVVDTDICIGSGECVGFDPEAVEIDQGCAHVLVDPMDEARWSIRLVADFRAQYRRVAALAREGR